LYAFLCRRGAGASVLAALMSRQRGARSAFVESISLFFRYALSLTAWETVRGNHMASCCAPQFRRAGTSTRRRDTSSCRRWTLSTAVPAYTTNASKAHGLELSADLILGLGGLDSSVSGGLIPRGAVVHSLAGGLEVWASVAFRYCQHDVGHALGSMRTRGGCPGVETPPARPCGLRAAFHDFST